MENIDPHLTMGQLATFYIDEGLSLHEQIHNKGKPFPKGSVPRGYRPEAHGRAIRIWKLKEKTP